MGFRGTRQGSVQTNYFDHPVRGFVGQIAVAPGLTLIDGYPVDDTNGVAVGIGAVKNAALTIASGQYGDRPASHSIRTPISTSTAADFLGIVVRDSAMPNDSDGNPLWLDETMASVMREGRIFVNAPVAITADDDVYMYVQNTTSHNRPIGSFTNAAAGVDTVQITGAKWYDSTPANSIGIIELERR